MLSLSPSIAILHTGEYNVSVYRKEIECKEVNKTQLALKTFQDAVCLMV
jgi:hypothetical protein